MELQIGEMTDWKFGLITREVERITDKFYLIHDTSCGWKTARVTKKTLDSLVLGEKSLLSLNWT